MGNRHLDKIEYLHTLGTPESERLKVTALPSPKRAYATEGLLPAGGLRAGRSKSFPPNRLPLFQKVGFFHITTQSPEEEGMIWEISNIFFYE
jgi:hypothetical protein